MTIRVRIGAETYHFTNATVALKEADQLALLQREILARAGHMQKHERAIRRAVAKAAGVTPTTPLTFYECCIRIIESPICPGR